MACAATKGPASLPRRGADEPLPPKGAAKVADSSSHEHGSTCWPAGESGGQQWPRDVACRLEQNSRTGPAERLPAVQCGRHLSGVKFIR